MSCSSFLLLAAAQKHDIFPGFLNGFPSSGGSVLLFYYTAVLAALKNGASDLCVISSPSAVFSSAHLAVT